MFHPEDWIEWLIKRIPNAIGSLVEAVGNKLGDKWGWPFIIPTCSLFLIWVFLGFADFREFAFRGWHIFIPPAVGVVSCAALSLAAFKVSEARRDSSMFTIVFMGILLPFCIPWLGLAVFMERDISLVWRFAAVFLPVFLLLGLVGFVLERWDDWSMAPRLVTVAIGLLVIVGGKFMPKPPQDFFRLEPIVNKYSPPPMGHK